MRFVHQHAEYVTAADGRNYVAQVYATEHDGRSWDAWCAFFPEKGDDFVVGGRETTQSSFDSVRYWASGLTHRYFEGALDRALAGGEAPPAEQAEAYAVAAERARDRAHEIQVMKRAMRRGIRFG